MLAQRVHGSPDIFGHREREPEQSLNFVTCHDGFTLNDVVSYNQKHNAANGEGNRDGRDDNMSWNCGAEGPSDDPGTERLRHRQVKNFFVAMLVSLGTPMLLMGDEMRRTQGGNNNAYCQDNEVSWLDWNLLDRHPDLHRFVRMIIAHRLRGMEARGDEQFGLSLNQLLRRARIEWHGIRLGQPDWTDDSHSIACTIRPGSGLLPVWLHMMFNAYWECLDFELPAVPATMSGWHRWIDTARESPEDITEPLQAPLVPEKRYRVMARSMVVLLVPIDDRLERELGTARKASGTSGPKL